jgi:hypothetical protein
MRLLIDHVEREASARPQRALKIRICHAMSRSITTSTSSIDECFHIMRW